MQEQQFKLLDKDGDGVVHIHEVDDLKKKLGERRAKGKDQLSNHESSLLDKIQKDHVDWHGKQDKDGNGHFTLEEYKQTVDPKKQKEAKKKAELSKAMQDFNLTDIHLTQKLQFELMDSDGDGSVSKEEMRDMRAKLKKRKELAFDFSKTEPPLAKHEDSLLGKLEDGPEKMHKKSDADDDGRLTWDEFKFKEPVTPTPAEL